MNKINKALMTMALLWLAFAAIHAEKVSESKARSVAQEFMQRGMPATSRAAGLNLSMVWVARRLHRVRPMPPHSTFITTRQARVSW